MVFKLQASGVSGNLYNLIVDFLSGRKQYVEIQGQRSIEAEVTVDLVFPKARYWALGYLVYILYVNDLPEVLSCGNLETFADDTTFNCSGDSVDDVCVSHHLFHLLLNQIHDHQPVLKLTWNDLHISQILSISLSHQYKVNLPLIFF